MAIGISALLLLNSSLAYSEQLIGRIIDVADGDTLALLPQSSEIKIRIRISGIDAPEKAQAYGEKSKNNLVQLARSKAAVADCKKKDQYGRQVCKVLVGNHDLGLEQISAGLAWWHRAYASEQSASDRRAYEAAEREAMESRTGLWNDASRVPPWEWRRARRIAPKRKLYEPPY